VGGGSLSGLLGKTCPKQAIRRGDTIKSCTAQRNPRKNRSWKRGGEFRNENYEKTRLQAGTTGAKKRGRDSVKPTKNNKVENEK